MSVSWHTFAPEDVFQPPEEDEDEGLGDYGPLDERDILEVEKRLARIHYGKSDFPSLLHVQEWYRLVRVTTPSLPALDPKWGYYRVWARMTSPDMVRQLFPDFPFAKNKIKEKKMGNAYLDQVAQYQVPGRLDVVSADFHASELDPAHRWGITYRGVQQYRVCCMQSFRLGSEPPGCWMQMDSSQPLGLTLPTLLWFQLDAGKQLWQEIADKSLYFDEKQCKDFVRQVISSNIQRGTVFMQQGQTDFARLIVLLQECLPELQENHWQIANAKANNIVPFTWPDLSPKMLELFQTQGRVNRYIPEAPLSNNAFVVYQWSKCDTHMDPSKLIKTKSGIILIRQLQASEVDRVIRELMADGLLFNGTPEMTALTAFQQNVGNLQLYQNDVAKLNQDAEQVLSNIQNPYYVRHFTGPLIVDVKDFDNYRNQVNMFYMKRSGSTFTGLSVPRVSQRILLAKAAELSEDAKFLQVVTPPVDVKPIDPVEQNDQLFGEWKRRREYQEQLKQVGQDNPLLNAETDALLLQLQQKTAERLAREAAEALRKQQEAAAALQRQKDAAATAALRKQQEADDLLRQQQADAQRKAAAAAAKKPPVSPPQGVSSSTKAQRLQAMRNRSPLSESLKEPWGFSMLLLDDSMEPVIREVDKSMDPDQVLDRYFLDRNVFTGRVNFVQSIRKKLVALLNQQLLVPGGDYWNALRSHGILANPKIPNQLAFPVDEIPPKIANWKAWVYGFLCLYAFGSTFDPKWLGRARLASVTSNVRLLNDDPLTDVYVEPVDVFGRGVATQRPLAGPFSFIPGDETKSALFEYDGNNSCAYDTFFTAFFRKPGTFLEKAIVQAKEAWVMDSIPDDPSPLHQSILNDIQYVQGTIPRLSKMCESKQLLAKFLPITQDGSFEADPSEIVRALYVFYGIDRATREEIIFLENTISTNVTPTLTRLEATPVQLVQFQNFNSQFQSPADLPEQSGAFYLGACIMRNAWKDKRGAHYTCMVKRPVDGQWQFVNDMAMAAVNVSVDDVKKTYKGFHPFTWIYFRSSEEAVRALVDEIERQNLRILDVPEQWKTDPNAPEHLRVYRDHLKGAVQDRFALDRARIFILRK